MENNPEPKKEARGAKPGNRNAAKSGGLDTGFSGRCHSRDKSQWVKAAQAKQMKLNAWMIEACNRVASEEKGSVVKNGKNE